MKGWRVTSSLFFLLIFSVLEIDLKKTSTVRLLFEKADIKGQTNNKKFNN